MNLSCGIAGKDNCCHEYADMTVSGWWVPGVFLPLSVAVHGA